LKTNIIIIKHLFPVCHLNKQPSTIDGIEFVSMISSHIDAPFLFSLSSISKKTKIIFMFLLYCVTLRMVTHTPIAFLRLNGSPCTLNNVFLFLTYMSIQLQRRVIGNVLLKKIIRPRGTIQEICFFFISVWKLF